MLKNKKIILVLLAFLVLFMFSSSVFASFDFNYNDVDYSFSDLPTDIAEYYCIVDDGNGYFSIYCGDTAITYDNDGRNLLYSTNIRRYCKQGMLGDWGGSGNTHASGIYKGQAYQVGAVIYSNHDIYYTNDSETVFFQKTPEALEETALAKITRESHPEEVLIQILKLIPLILVVVVSFLGFRKAWSLLSNLLHKA